MELLKRKNPQSQKKRIGRGDRRGKTSGRGHKGQKSRAGHRLRPQLRDTIKKLPKRRGHGIHRGQSVVSTRVKPTVVNIGTIARAFNKGDSVTPNTLAGKGLVHRKNGRLPQVKILAGGEISTPVTVSGCDVSSAAQAAIEKAGGTVSNT